MSAPLSTLISRALSSPRNGGDFGPDRPLLMGILNTTPDSFSDGGACFRPDDALRQAVRMVAEGADLLDIGGESTRPGAADVGQQEELDRVLPVIERLRAELDTPLSIDTSKPAVMRAAVAAGAAMINDVLALRAEGALQAAAELAVPVCLMHMQGQPRDMQRDPRYRDVVAEVSRFLLDRASACEQAGMSRDSVLLDPGFGFGKTLQHNQKLFAAIPQLATLGFPLLVGVSRKSMLGQMTGQPVDQRLVASAVAAALAARAGARILRVHDVAATRDALAVFAGLDPTGGHQAN